MKIGFIASGNIHDRTLWSGTISFLADALARNNTIIPLEQKSAFLGLCNRALSIMTRRKITRSILAHRLETHQLTRKIHQANCDVLFAPAASELIADVDLPDGRPLVYLSDATFHVMNGYYAPLQTGHDQRFLEHCEASSLRKAAAVILSSQWAADDAIRHYGCQPEKVHVLPFGANLPDQLDLEKKRNPQDDNTVRLLLVGVDWKRKGVDIAIDTVRLLNQHSTTTTYELTIIGFSGPQTPQNGDPHVRYMGRLNKNNPEELQRMVDAYQSSDIFILPTQAECAGIVFSEAAMYALPVITYATGDTTTYVQDGVTGSCLKPGSSAEEFAKAIDGIISGGKLSEYAANARTKYEQELNWDTWLSRFSEILHSL